MTWGYPAKVKVLLFVGDIAALQVAMLLTALLRRGQLFNILEVFTGASLIFILTCLASLYLFDLYNLAELRRGPALLFRTGLAIGTAALLTGFVFFFLPTYRYGRGLFALLTLLMILLAYGWRLVCVNYGHALLEHVPTLVLGTNGRAEAIRELLARSDSHYRLVGFVRAGSDPPQPAVPPGDVLAEEESLAQTVRAHNVGCLVVASDSLGTETARLLTRLRFERRMLYEAPKFYMQIAEELPVEFLSDAWLSFVEGFGLWQNKLAWKLKRLGDLALAAGGLLLALPVLVVTAAAIKLDSPGPVLIRQRRVGWLEQPFELLKFRSMLYGADGGSAQWTTVNDPRITRVGRWIRKLHIDEIPQMVNVLKGEMSFIGPRPEQPEFVERLKQIIPFYHLRHYVLPGITGWAQVQYPYGASVEDAKRKLQYDLYYIVNASLLFDLRIFLRTVRVVLFQRGSR